MCYIYTNSANRLWQNHSKFKSVARITSLDNCKAITCTDRVPTIPDDVNCYFTSTGCNLMEYFDGIFCSVFIKLFVISSTNYNKNYLYLAHILLMLFLFTYNYMCLINQLLRKLLIISDYPAFVQVPSTVKRIQALFIVHVLIDTKTYVFEKDNTRSVNEKFLRNKSNIVF
jgi:hypothetical protein